MAGFDSTTCFDGAWSHRLPLCSGKGRILWLPRRELGNFYAHTLKMTKIWRWRSKYFPIGWLLLSTILECILLYGTIKFKGEYIVKHLYIFLGFHQKTLLLYCFQQIARTQDFHEMVHGEVTILNTVKRLTSRAIMATRWLVASQWTVGTEFGVHLYLSAKVS